MCGENSRGIFEKNAVLHTRRYRICIIDDNTDRRSERFAAPPETMAPVSRIFRESTVTTKRTYYPERSCCAVAAFLAACSYPRVDGRGRAEFLGGRRRRSQRLRSVPRVSTAGGWRRRSRRTFTFTRRRLCRLSKTMHIVPAVGSWATDAILVARASCPLFLLYYETPPRKKWNIIADCVKSRQPGSDSPPPCDCNLLLRHAFCRSRATLRAGRGTRRAGDKASGRRHHENVGAASFRLSCYHRARAPT